MKLAFVEFIKESTSISVESTFETPMIETATYCLSIQIMKDIYILSKFMGGLYRRQDKDKILIEA